MHNSLHEDGGEEEQGLESGQGKRNLHTFLSTSNNFLPLTITHNCVFLNSNVILSLYYIEVVDAAAVFNGIIVSLDITWYGLVVSNERIPILLSCMNNEYSSDCDSMLIPFV